MSNHFIAHVATPTGTVQEDMYLDSELAVAREATRRGWVLVDVREHKPFFWAAPRFSREYQSMFLHAMLMYVDVAVPIGTALLNVIAAEDNKNRRSHMAGAEKILMRGGDFSEAIDQLRWLDPVAAQILRGADATGSASALRAAIGHLDAQTDGLKRFLPLAIVLLTDLTFIPPVSLVIKTTFAPMIRNHLASIPSDKAVAALHNLSMADMANTVMMYATTAALVTIALVLWFYVTAPETRDAINRLAARFPLLKRYFTSASAAASFGVVANMLRGGMPFYRCAAMAGRMTNGAGIEKSWVAIASALDNGAPLATALRHGALLRDAEARLIAAAPDEKHVADVFERMAALRLEEARRASRRVLKLAIWGLAIHLAIAIGIAFWLYQIFAGSVDMNLSVIRGM